MEKLFEYLISEWVVLQQAPIAFLLSIVVGLGCGWFAASKFYKERLSVQETRISDYQERLGLVPPDRTAYSKLTNKELQKLALELVDKLHEFQGRIKREDRALSDQRWASIVNANDSERDQRFQQYVAMSSIKHDERQLEFQRDYRAQAIGLRDEIVKRLPVQQSKTVIALDYGMLAGPSPIGDIAVHLEHISRLLP